MFLQGKQLDSQEIRAALRAWEEVRGNDSLGEAQLLAPDAEELERLRALGYVR